MKTIRMMNQDGASHNDEEVIVSNHVAEQAEAPVAVAAEEETAPADEVVDNSSQEEVDKW